MYDIFTEVNNSVYKLILMQQSRRPTKITPVGVRRGFLQKPLQSVASHQTPHHSSQSSKMVLVSLDKTKKKSLSLILSIAQIFQENFHIFYCFNRELLLLENSKSATCEENICFLIFVLGVKYDHFIYLPIRRSLALICSIYLHVFRVR